MAPMWMLFLKPQRSHMGFAQLQPALVVGGACIVALALRLIQLGAPLWGDEVATWAFARRSPLLEMWRYAAHDPTPPLYYALIHFCLPFLGDSPTALRLPSVVFGVLILPVMYVGVRSAGLGRTTAVWSIALAATSSMLIYYAQEARAYAMLTLLGTLATIILFWWSTRNKRSYGWAYAAAGVALVLTHRYGLFLIAAHVLYALTMRRWQFIVVTGGLLGVGGLLLLIQVVDQSFTFGAAGDPTNWQAFTSLINTLTTGTIGLQSIGKLPNQALLRFPHAGINRALPFVGLGVWASVIGVGMWQWRQQSAMQRRLVTLLGLCIVVPVALALLAGSPWSPRPQWLLRGLIFIWPLAFMLASAVLDQWRGRAWLLGSLVVLQGFALYPYYANYTRFNDAAAFAYLNQHTTNQDLVVVDPWYMHDFVDYYYRGPAQLVGFDQQGGWVDVEQMERRNAALFLPLPTLPATAGNVYVYYRKDRIAWAKLFPNNSILVYDARATTWRPYAAP